MMAQAHITALRKKHEKLEERIHAETNRAARDDQAIKRMKLEKLYVQEEIQRLRAD
jgi:hypothetical protein